MTLENQLKTMLRLVEQSVQNNKELIESNKELHEEVDTLRKHVDALTIMQTKALAPVLGIQIEFQPEEISSVEAITGMRLNFISEEFDRFKPVQLSLVEDTPIEE